MIEASKDWSVDSVVSLLMGFIAGVCADSGGLGLSKVESFNLGRLILEASKGAYELPSTLSIWRVAEGPFRV